MVVISKKYDEIIKVGEAFIKVRKSGTGVKFYVDAPDYVKVNRLKDVKVCKFIPMCPTGLSKQKE